MLKKILSILFVLATFCFAGKYPVNSIEYGISLNTEKFSDENSVEKYQQHLFNLVETARIDGDEYKLDKERIVSYWDTEDRLLRKQKIIVRLRENGTKYEVTIKYRGDNQELAENWNLSTSYKTKSKTEIDRYVNKDSFSRSITVKTKSKELTSAMLLEIFPELAKYGLSATSKLDRVNKFKITDQSYEIGEYRFGKKKAPKKTTTSDFDLALWKCESGKVIAAEISWKIRNKGVKSKSALKRANDVLNTIVNDKEWTAKVSRTKTSLAYDGQNICK